MAKRDIDNNLVTAIEKEAFPLGDGATEVDHIVNAAADKRFVLIGEATHGTQEFYRIRADITQRLIEEKGFDAVAVEADWPDAYAVHRYVSGLVPEQTAQEALSAFERFPAWMWRNTEVLHFIEWLKAWNTRPDLGMQRYRMPVGFYGLDLYSMNTSIHAVIAYLDKTDHAAAQRARERYACLDHFMDNPQIYYATEARLAKSCEDEIATQLTELRMNAWDYVRRDGYVAED